MNPRARKFLLLLLAAAMWAAAGFTQRSLNIARATLGLTRVTPLENAPPLLAFTTVALGGFRGLICNFLWVRANDQQQAGHYFEAYQLADWITKLQPHSASVWRYQAWNMAYNISVKFRDPADRWRWVSRGIELLRDEGLRYHPTDTRMYQELGLFYQHKVGYYMDDAHGYYKNAWAQEMMRVLGVEQPDYLSLINPGTADQRARATVLREKYKLDPARMKTIDERFGPLDWRLPDAHAIYWAALGLDTVTGKEGRLALRRVIWQSMAQSVTRGRLIAVGAIKQFETGPNLEIIPKTHAAFEEMIADDPGHKNMLVDAVRHLYLHNRIADANAWFRKLKELYPEAVPPADTLDDFAVKIFSDRAQGSSRDQVQAMLEGLLATHFELLAMDIEERAQGMFNAAAQIWKRHQVKFADQQERMGLKPFAQIRQDVLDRVLAPESRLEPALKAQLRTRLNLPAAAATNAPPAATAPK
jgi:hypothetical protein